MNLFTNLSEQKVRLNKLSPIFINCFIVLYFAFVSLWLYANNFSTQPPPNYAKEISALISPVIKLFGIDQLWCVFCPAVRTENHYSLAVISMQNGFLQLCEMPRMEKLDLMNKTQCEKFRKLFNDNFPYQKFYSARPAFSRFLANNAYSKYNPPTRIAYFLITEPIAPADVTVQSKESKKSLRPSISNYFVYGVSPEDFK